MEEESEEEVGKGEEGGGGGGGGRGGEGEQKGQRPLGCLSESLGMSFGSLLEASWGVLGASWRSQGLLGASWMPRGSVLGPLGGILGASWRPLGASWAPPGAILEAIDQKKGWILFPPPRRGLQVPLGAILGHPGRSNPPRPLPSRSRGGGRGRGQDTLCSQGVPLTPTRPPNT